MKINNMNSSNATAKVVASYSYKPQKFISILGVAFFALGFKLMVELALSNEVGLDLYLYKKIIHFSLSSTQATIFYVILSIAMLGMLFMLILALFLSFFSKAKIIISDKTISIPKKKYTTESINIPFEDITFLGVKTIQKNHILQICFQDRQIRIDQSLLQKKHYFDEIYETLLNNISKPKEP